MHRAPAISLSTSPPVVLHLDLRWPFCALPRLPPAVLRTPSQPGATPAPFQSRLGTRFTTIWKRLAWFVPRCRCNQGWLALRGRHRRFNGRACAARCAACSSLAHAHHLPELAFALRAAGPVRAGSTGGTHTKKASDDIIIKCQWLALGATRGYAWQRNGGVWSPFHANCSAGSFVAPRR